MRAAFNTTCDIFCGPGTATPGALRGTFDCRVVAQEGIFFSGTDMVDRVAWITIEDLRPSSALDLLSEGWRPSHADQIAVPSGTDPQYWVMLTEYVFWGAQPFYWRANVAYLPLPDTGPLWPAMGSPGLLFGDESAGPEVPAGGPGILFGAPAETLPPA